MTLVEAMALWRARRPPYLDLGCARTRKIPLSVKTL